MTPIIDVVDFEDGDEAYLTELSIAPLGMASIASVDASDDSKEVLLNLAGQWDRLWPEILEKLQEGMVEYGVSQELGVEELVGTIARLDPEEFLGDKSDLFLRLEIEDVPVWDFFLKDGSVVYFQATF